MRRKAGSGVRLLALAVALVLLYLVPPAYLGGSMQMILRFTFPGGIISAYRPPSTS